MSHKSDEFQIGENQILDLAYDMARLNGVQLTLNQIEGGSQGFILKIGISDKMVQAQLSEEEIEDYPGKAGIDMTRTKVLSAIERLKMMA